MTPPTISPKGQVKRTPTTTLTTTVAIRPPRRAGHGEGPGGSGSGLRSTGHPYPDASRSDMACAQIVVVQLAGLRVGPVRRGARRTAPRGSGRWPPGGPGSGDE